jgi:hypothetical protein
MSQINHYILSKIEILTKNLKEDFRKKGFVIPTKNDDGSVSVGNYRIFKDDLGFYSIADHRKEIIVKNINLPQTAVLTANRLALGKWKDETILAIDTKYGHALFDEKVHQRLAEKNLKSNDHDMADLMLTKLKIARYKKEKYKNEVFINFRKLLYIR